jgi:hypothetical protein
MTADLHGIKPSAVILVHRSLGEGGDHRYSNFTASTVGAHVVRTGIQGSENRAARVSKRSALLLAYETLTAYLRARLCFDFSNGTGDRLPQLLFF